MQPLKKNPTFEEVAGLLGKFRPSLPEHRATDLINSPAITVFKFEQGCAEPRGTASSQTADRCCDQGRGTFLWHACPCLEGACALAETSG